MNEKFKMNPLFYEYYLSDLSDRCSKCCYSSLLYFLVNELKKNDPGISINPNDLQQLRKNTLESTENAMNYLFNSTDKIEKLYPHNIQKIAYLINEPFGYSYGYRKTTVSIQRQVSFVPVEAREIPSRMMSLLDTYYNVWNQNDFFEREAAFHINLVRMQPFEDGNKRTAQIITGFNLLQKDFAPILISEEEKDKYLNFIDNNDVKGFAEFMKQKSILEMKYVDELYKKFNNESVKTK